MATTYTWDLQQIELISKGDFNQVVHRCFWKCTATADSGATKDQFGVVDLDVNNLDPETFKAFNTLDKADIIAWVKSVVHTSSVEGNLHPETTSHSYVDTSGPGVVAVNTESTSTNA
jgi:hypothetical protein